ncbi:MAG: peptidoglycan editing factor PgeF [Candidatus Omnitrophica bacterium]|nr:peptidoglycan editing factor PgeF [Candidatus Omnitrophota bacterium]MBL7210612.1 peptidoglycan editing factor PgeF [Candidatus Omnitrophota bacterium]
MGFIYCTSSRPDGNMSLCYGDTRDAVDNRKAFLAKSGIDYPGLVCAKQVHGAGVYYVTEKDSGRGALDYQSSIDDTDAFISDKKNLALAIFTADCPAIFLYDPLKPAIGLIHAGWRSTKQNIVKKTIRLMQERFGSEPGGLKVTLGPAIRSCCYEVGEEFSDTFGSAVTKRGSRYYLDLSLVNTRELLECGVGEENISDSKVCTCCRDNEFFSFRREGDACGRMMAVAALSG